MTLEQMVTKISNITNCNDSDFISDLIEYYEVEDNISEEEIVIKVVQHLGNDNDYF